MLVTSPIPNPRMNSGTSDDFGSEYVVATSGPKNSSARREVAIASPIATPMIEPIASPANVRSRLDELASALEADRSLRLGSPPPSSEQLAYSTALVRQQAEQLRGALRPPAV